MRRPTCARCRRPESVCYCRYITPFCSSPRILILMHEEEVRRPIATGRMAHLALSNSALFIGTDFTEHAELNAVLASPNHSPLLLYPGPNATNLTRLSLDARRALAPRPPLVIVPDGTWRTAKRIRRLSRNLHGLPEVTFTPPGPSGFVVRRQPGAQCFSTIEAIHQIIGLFSPHETRHHCLLAAFAFMVAEQMRRAAL